MVFIHGSSFARRTASVHSMLALRRPISANRFFGARSKFHTLPLLAQTNVPATARSSLGKRIPFIYKAGGVAGVGLGLSLFPKSSVNCDAPVNASPQKEPSFDSIPPPPSSSVNVYELTFGTVCGICSGVFIKKGARAVAFFVGGIFVLLQYFGSLSVLRVDWGRMSARFENIFFTKNPDGTKRPPSLYSLWVWAVEFLTADFQQRASFVAGLALGLRIG